ncbi:protein PHLOEM PROTEIN 2-LIKE A1-like [Gastrolobium bilobum]|uniref:protein PHLOEM PROTEIN 2-LIKE A1-like n=1 Tax=Gastrolobium bilobum TaxID=150636 RepID=UPI002AB1C1CE|nr:protein PHLOEM PROTEIN 2-LIKE A1-like [Gastrolobium bilobum]
MGASPSTPSSSPPPPPLSLPSPQPQSQPLPQSQPKPQSPQLRPQTGSQPQPQSQPKLQPQPGSQPQPQSHEPISRETWLLPFLGEAKSSTNSTKAVENIATVVKRNETQSMTSPLKPLKELNFPHNYEHILKDADSPVDKSSREKLCDQLYAGVFLDNKTKKYWLEKKSNSNCFMLYARALSITWAEDQNYWKWVLQKESSGTMAEVAELKRVCWLEVHGKFDTRKLSPGILYEVSFIVMLKDAAQGWELPVNVRLSLPGGKKQQHKEALIDKLRMRWIEVPVGEFVASEKDVGEMEISMYEYEGGMWKQGLVIKGVAIKPKN